MSGTILKYACNKLNTGPCVPCKCGWSWKNRDPISFSISPEAGTPPLEQSCEYTPGAHLAYSILSLKVTPLVITKPVTPQVRLKFDELL